MDRKQINIRTDDEFEQAIDDIRRMLSPIPPAAKVIRAAVMQYRDNLLKTTKGKVQ